MAGPTTPREAAGVPPAATPAPAIDLDEASVAGEEDPGAALDIDATPVPVTPPREPAAQSGS